MGTRGGRRRLLSGLAVIVVAGAAGAAWAATRSSHGNPDPGGRTLAALKSVERALPADAQVLLRQANEPSWDSCDGRAGTFGWDAVSAGVQFRTGMPARMLVAAADRVLSSEGWQRTGNGSTPLGPGASWTRTLAGATVATATLAPGTRGDGSGIYWDLEGVAPPQGPQVNGC